MNEGIVLIVNLIIYVKFCLLVRIILLNIMRVLVSVVKLKCRVDVDYVLFSKMMEEGWVI